MSFFPWWNSDSRELQQYQQIQELIHRQVDIGYVPMRFPELESELIFECLRKAQYLVALPPDHPLAKQRYLRLSALANEKFISLQRALPGYNSSFVSLCRSAGFTPQFTREEADRPLSLLGWVSAGFGIALVPETFRQILSIAVEFRPLRPSVPTFDMHVAWRRDNQSPVLHAFLEMLREHAQADAKLPEKVTAAKDSNH